MLSERRGRKKIGGDKKNRYINIGLGDLISCIYSYNILSIDIDTWCCNIIDVIE